jgi:hypothetical protein
MEEVTKEEAVPLVLSSRARRVLPYPFQTWSTVPGHGAGSRGEFCLSHGSGARPDVAPQTERMMVLSTLHRQPLTTNSGFPGDLFRALFMSASSFG